MPARIITASLVAALLSGASAAQVTGAGTRLCGDYGAPHPDMPEAFSQFAFIIGDFDVGMRAWNADTQAWDEAQYVARWNGRYIFGGRAIQDFWFDPGYGYRPNAGAGTNVRLYDAEEEVWKTAWHYTANTEVRELRQKVREDGLLHLWQVYPAGTERNVHFEIYEDGRWARIDHALKPDTGEWTPRLKYDAVPAACEAQ